MKFHSTISIGLWLNYDTKLDWTLLGALVRLTTSFCCGASGSLTYLAGCDIILGMKTQKMFQPCPQCGHTMNSRAKLCGACSPRGRGLNAKVVTLVCKYCQEQFILPEWRYNQGRGSFCSKDCKDKFLTTIKGQDHHKYTGRNVNAPYQGTNWKQAKRAVLERANGRCEWCGVEFSKVKKVSIHHHIGSHKFATKDESHYPDNLSAICQSCHAKFHGLGKIPKKKGGDAHE